MSSNGDDQSPQSQKTNTGRRKLPMVKIQRLSNRQVTFSKRRSGVFKKTHELCTLTGSDAAVVVFSPANKPFSFGHPNVHDVVNRFENPAGQNYGENNSGNEEVTGLLEELARMESVLEAQRAKRKELEKTMAKLEKEKKVFTPNVIQKMSYEELKKLRGSMLELKARLEARKQREAIDGDNNCGEAAGDVIPYEEEAIEVIDAADYENNGELFDGGEGCSEDGSVDMVVERLDDGVGRRFF